MAGREKEEARGGRNCVARASNGRGCKKYEEKGISNALVSNWSGCGGKVHGSNLFENTGPTLKIPVTSNCTALCSAHFEDDCYEYKSSVIDTIEQSGRVRVRLYKEDRCAHKRYCCSCSSRRRSKWSNERTSKPNICDIKTYMFDQLRSTCIQWYKLILLLKQVAKMWPVVVSCPSVKV